MSYKQSKPLKSLKWYKELADVENRQEAGAFLVEGEKAIRQIIEAQPDAILEILSISPPPENLRRYNTRLVADGEFRYICRTKTPQGIAALVHLPAETYTETIPEKPGSRVVLLEDVQDPGNVGTLIRTAAAFDFDGVILSEKCADPFSPKSLQSTAGSVLSVWLRRTAGYLNMVKTLKQQGFNIVAADLDGDSDTSVLSGRDKLALALGNEAAGLSTSIVNIADYRVRIPVTRGKAESLNVAVCGGILMYVINSKLKSQNSKVLLPT